MASLYDTSAIRMVVPDKGKENSIFSDKELNYEPAGAKDAGLLDRFLNWLLDELFGKTDYATRHTVSQVMMWGLAFVALGVVIWLLTKTEFGNFIRGRSAKAEFSFSDVGEDIKTIDFGSKIKEALQQEDYRLAIRWYYLKQLNTLNNKNWIEWEVFKTNIDYLRELKKSHSQFVKPFDQLNNIYDHVWYGKYDITETDYLRFESVFKQFEMSIGV